jgi:hypothetical protein
MIARTSCNKQLRGKKMRTRFDDDADEIGDGESVRVPLLLCDSVSRRFAFGDAMDSAYGRRPGYARLSNEQVAERRRARDEMIERATSAWRNDARRKPPDYDDDAHSTADARAAANRAYDAYCARLKDAWRRPARDAAKPDLGAETDPGAAAAIEQQRERWLGSGESLDALRIRIERQRAEQHREYCERLSNAWKTNKGAADPNAEGPPSGNACIPLPLLLLRPWCNM